MRFVPYESLGEIPNVIVDGAAQQATVLTLSHWPHSGTPPALQADLSAEIAWRYLDRASFHGHGAEVVSNNHFDEDGLAGLFAMIDPERAAGKRDELVDLARAGDFGRFESRRSARLSFAVSAFADADRSPLGREVFAQSYPAVAAALYVEMLDRLPDLLDHLDAYRGLWEEEDALLAAGERAIADGMVTLEEVPALDLAVITIPPATTQLEAHRFTQRRAAWIHPMAVHNATNRLRILTVCGEQVELHFRYETWVQLASYRPMPRIDVTPLAEHLTALEAGRARWQFDGVGAIAPRLAVVDGESELGASGVRKEVESFLAAPPPQATAWDPYD